MADDKKVGPKKVDPVEEILFILLILVMLSVFFRRAYVFLSSRFGDVNPDTFIGYFNIHVVPVLKFFSFGISALSFVGILYAISQLTKINILENEIFHPAHFSLAPAEKEKNRRWERVLEHMNSVNPNDWKFAILEADIILDDLLTTMRYGGETVADRLKSIEKSDFNTIEDAWEAHKVRNSIAHQGADFLITEREARRVIGLYQNVFEEFSFI